MHVWLWIAINWINNFLSAHWCTFGFIHNKFPRYTWGILDYTICYLSQHFLGNRNLIVDIIVICIIVMISIRLFVTLDRYCIFLIVSTDTTVCRNLAVIHFCHILNCNNFIIGHTWNDISKSLTIRFSGNILIQCLTLAWLNRLNFFEFKNISTNQVFDIYICIVSLRSYSNSIFELVISTVITSIRFLNCQIMFIFNMDSLLYTITKFDFLSIFGCIKFCINFNP